MDMPAHVAAAMARYFAPSEGSPLSRLRADWWRTLFDAVYLQTDGDVVEDASITQAEVSFLLSELPLSAGHRVLDLCCGQGRHALELARRVPGLDVTGLDQSAFLIDLAAHRTPPSSRDRIRFFMGDCRALPFARGSFDAVVVMGNSFGYFDAAAQDDAVLAEVARVLRPGGRVIIDVTDGDYMRAAFAHRSWEHVDPQVFVIRARELDAANGRLVSREVVLQGAPDDVTLVRDACYAERLYSEGDMAGLLARGGFVGARRAGRLNTGGMSQREDSDLGMMARRIVMVAEARDIVVAVAVVEQQQQQAAIAQVSMAQGATRAAAVVS